MCRVAAVVAGCCRLAAAGLLLPLLAVLQVRTDWAALIDNWAVRFLHEMDYTREAANAALFRCLSQG